MEHPILILGTGYLGSRIAEYFGDRATAIRIDITDISQVRAAIAEHKPQVVINAAAYTKTHEAEKPEHQRECFAVNVQGPLNVALVAREAGVRMVHLSTGMIFDGEGADGNGFKEEDVPNPTSYYTWTKAWADAALTPYLEQDGILILRLHLPLSKFSHPRNLLNKLGRFSSYLNAEGSFTVVEDLLAALDNLIEQKATGIFHVVNPGKISFLGIAQILQKNGRIAADKELITQSKADFDAMIAANGGAYQPASVLNTEKLQAREIHLREIHQAIEECARDFVEESTLG